MIGLDRSELRAILELSDSLIEMHIHGSITRDHIARVTMSRETRDHYWELAERASAVPEPWPREYDMVPYFQDVVSLLTLDIGNADYIGAMSRGILGEELSDAEKVQFRRTYRAWIQYWNNLAYQRRGYGQISGRGMSGLRPIAVVRV